MFMWQLVYIEFETAALQAGYQKCYLK